jgi:hypothetical protein
MTFNLQMKIFVWGIMERSVAMVVEKIIAKTKLTTRHSIFLIKGNRKNTSWMKTIT